MESISVSVMREKHLIRLARATVVPVHPKPMVEGGRVLGEEGWEPAALTDYIPIINYHGNASRVMKDILRSLSDSNVLKVSLPSPLENWVSLTLSFPHPNKSR